MNKKGWILGVGMTIFASCGLLPSLYDSTVVNNIQSLIDNQQLIYHQAMAPGADVHFATYAPLFAYGDSLLAATLHEDSTRKRKQTATANLLKYAALFDKNKIAWQTRDTITAAMDSIEVSQLNSALIPIYNAEKNYKH